MRSKFLEFELKLCPGLDPGAIIMNLTKRFNFRNIVLDDIDRTEDFEGLIARVGNLANGIDAKATIMEDATFQGYDAVLCTYNGPVIGFLDDRRQIVRAELSAYTFQNISCRGRLVRKAERQGYTPEWWPFEDTC